MLLVSYHFEKYEANDTNEDNLGFDSLHRTWVGMRKSGATHVREL